MYWFANINLAAQPATSTAKQITLADIFQKGTFGAKWVPGFTFMNDGKSYSTTAPTRAGAEIVLKQVKDDKEFENLNIPKAMQTADPNWNFKDIDDYKFSPTENSVLLFYDSERIYRHSSIATAYVYDVKTQTAWPVNERHKIALASFSPDGEWLAFVANNNLYIQQFSAKKGALPPIAVTTDGAHNEIINGKTDWVYEEEFAFTQAFEWSPEGNYLAYIRFDEKQVPEFTMTHFRDKTYPDYETFKYPKVGEKNAIVSVHIYDVKNEKTVQVPIPEGDFYLPRIKWTQDDKTLCITHLNRHQNKLQLLLANAKTGKYEVLLTEENKYYIDIHDNLTFLPDGKTFLWTSEKDGYNHLYLYDLTGKLVRQITKGDWEITAFYGFNKKNNMLYYQSTQQAGPLERQVFSIDINGANLKKIATETGTSEAQFSPNFSYYMLNWSKAGTPNRYTLHEQDGKLVRVLEDNADLIKLMAEYKFNPVEFQAIPGADNTKLNTWTIKPSGFNRNNKYPVLMFVYGGPGSQTVKNEWGISNYFWFQLLSQKGYMIVSVDNRCTGARGEQFKKMTYLELGKYETEDQIAAATYLSNQLFVDSSRIGIFGWSYGGYMSSLCLLKGNDVFKTAIAVAPVTNWKWYDPVYTERFMRTEKENPKGYHDNSPVYFADQLKGNYLLLHGMGDDNVHFQNTAEMANALIAANKQFDTYFYPNKNHGIYGGNSRMHLFTKMTNFLLEKL